MSGLPRRALVALLATVFSVGVRAQEDVQRRLDEMRALIESQNAEIKKLKDDHAAAMQAMEAKVAAAGAAADIDQQISDAIENRVGLRTKPEFGGVRALKDRYLFTTEPNQEAIPGGLFVTGLFRTRAELRANNVDFNTSDTGLDDSGFRLNGRFRLGIGATFTPTQATHPNWADMTTDQRGDSLRISALTEYQAYGNAANNTFVQTGGAPFALNVLTEPFENVSLYQGLLRADNLFAKDFMLQVGRQELVLGSQLFFGNNSFFDGVAQDAIRVQWGSIDAAANEGFGATAFYAKKAASDASIPGPVQDFDEDEVFGLFGAYRPAKNATIDAYWFHFRGNVGANGDIYATGSSGSYFDNLYSPLILGRFETLGVRGYYGEIEIGGDTMLGVGAEVAYQTGRDESTGTDRSLHGWVMEAVANYRLFNPLTKTAPGGLAELRPIVALQLYHATGGDATSGGYQPLFVNRHFEIGRLEDRNSLGATARPYYPGGGRYGNMDSIPLDNVFIAKLAASVMADDRWEVGFGLNWAILDETAHLPSGGSYGSDVFGTEIDLFANYFASSTIQFGVNASILFPGEGGTALSNDLFFGPASAFTGVSDDDAALAVYFQALLQF